jgi:hypothetical protein
MTTKTRVKWAIRQLGYCMLFSFSLFWFGSLAAAMIRETINLWMAAPPEGQKIIALVLAGGFIAWLFLSLLVWANSPDEEQPNA